MNIIQSFKLAISSIFSNKMRSILTMLGMIIGVAAVIVIIGLSNGVSDYVMSQFAGMGTNTLTINYRNMGTRRVTVDDMYDFAEKNSDIILGVSPTVSANYRAKNGTKKVNSSVSGVSEEYDKINGFEISSGRFLCYADVYYRKPVCVIGTYVVNELFDDNNVIGKTIKMSGEPFTIIGVVKETANGDRGSADDCIYVPYTKLSRMQKVGDITSFSMASVDADKVDAVQKKLEDFLKEKLKSEDLYSIFAMSMLLNEVNKITDMMATILGSIAAISLVVAGIGIMNIMLVSVSERTKEIGIRKSLGARRRDIMQQFVIEAACISAFGGVLGIALGSGAVILLGNAFKVNAAPGTGAVIMAFSISAGIGILFGWMPARKAAALNPIDALRSE